MGTSGYQNFMDFVDELGFDIRKNNEQSNIGINKTPFLSHILCKLEEQLVWALVDSGSQVTAISEDFYSKIKKDKRILELPVTNITVSTAIGSKMMSVKKKNSH